MSSTGQTNISGFIGLTIALLMYGVALGQFYEYFRSFPRDRPLLKYLVILIFIINLFQVYLTIENEWWLLGASHGADPTRATLWQVQANIVTSMMIPFIVQSFYGKRLWTITQKNRTITSLVWLLSFSQFLFGMISSLWQAPAAASIRFPFTGLYGFLGVLCDILTTVSVYFYLRPGRSGVKRTWRGIQRLIIVTIHMGALTSTVTLAIAISWAINKGPSSILTPVMVVAQSYVNSLLAVLNARRWGYGEVYAAPTLTTIRVESEI